MSQRFASRHASTVWLALWGSLVASATSCGSGGDVYVGRASTRSSGTGGGSNGGVGVCGAQPCADHRDVTRVFTDASAPADAADRFGTATDVPSGADPVNEATLLYPSHETMFPLRVRNVRHEWRGGPEGALFELEFKGPNTTVLVYTTQRSFVPGEEAWDYIAESNRGHAVIWTVRCLVPGTPSRAVRSAAHTLLYSTQAVDGAIYYWSTAGQGVMKALISDPNPLKFYPNPAAGGADSEKCAGCHTLSRDGKRLAVTLDPDDLRVVTVPERGPVLPSSGMGGATMKSDKAAWSTFSPDGTRLLVASAGKMKLLDANTGAPIGKSDVIAVEKQFATHPDWSALGDQVAFTLADKGGDRDVEGGSIAVAKFADDAFGEPEVLVASKGEAGGDNNYFPVWSPDSRYLAFVNTTGKSQDSAPARLKLFDMTERRIVELPRLNQRVNELDGVMKLGNSMPTWAPNSAPGLFWLGFSSIREYASVRARDKKRDQIWIAAIDPSLADPSYAAFWAPFQGIEHGNHRAFWTHTSEDRPCRCNEICGDQIDNDCDGSADEPDCVASCTDREICDDGIDNDCDCVIDNCSKEICDDGVDNDGDKRADAMDPSCMEP